MKILSAKTQVCKEDLVNALGCSKESLEGTLCSLYENDLITVYSLKDADFYTITSAGELVIHKILKSEE